MRKPSSEFSTRYAKAKRFRDAEKPFIQEVLQYCCPGREHDFNRQAHSHRAYDTEVYNSLAEELATDFASDLVTYFTPAEVKWASYLVTIDMGDLPKESQKEVLRLVQARENDLFDLIQQSNYNDVAPQVMFEACHGTPAMWVQKGHISTPIHVETVPPHELLLVPGYMGVLDRFREKSIPVNEIKPLFDGWDVDLSDPNIQKKIKDGKGYSKVCWGFYVDWSDPPNPLWKYECTVDGISITPQPITLGGLAGSCPLLVGRFNPQVGQPWGRGPGRKALPDLRVLDKIEEIVLSGLDQSILNTLIYPDDGFLDLGDGIEAGRAYPAHRGFTRDQIYELQKGVNLDYGFFSEERLEDRIRTAFYQDGPRQRGDTPPTASQWLDERRRTQQRLGKPSAPLWTELFYPFVQRVEYLGVQSGRLEDAITHNGDIISVLPVSPLQKAQNQDKVMVARSNLELGIGVFPEALPVDPVATFENIVKASGDELTVIAQPQEPNAATPPPPQ